MPDPKPSKVIIDTNLWISFLIGKELHQLKDLIVNERIQLVISDQLLEELILVTSRKKLKKYFDQEKVTELITLLTLVSKKVKIKKIDKVCRDPKDDFLLALSKEAKADFLMTGDKDLLDLKIYGRTQILTVKKFSEILK
jgi:putative PIN family toxin of toxin-antitoxin system